MEVYTYIITSEDGRHFTCTRRAAHGEEVSAPPEELLLTLEEEPDRKVWGKSLADLYKQLTEKIKAHLLLT